MATRLIERTIEYQNNQSEDLTHHIPEINWMELKRIGIDQPAPKMTGWKAMQRYIGERRIVIRLISDLMKTHQKTDLTYGFLLDQRRNFSKAQAFDRLRLAGKR